VSGVPVPAVVIYSFLCFWGLLNKAVRPLSFMKKKLSTNRGWEQREDVFGGTSEGDKGEDMLGFILMELHEGFKSNSKDNDILMLGFPQLSKCSFQQCFELI